MYSQNNFLSEIQGLATGIFDQQLVREFVETILLVAGAAEIKDYFLQISKDEGDELEFGFFTESEIADITLSRGKVYSCHYSLKSIRDIQITDLNHKVVLTITGEKKFDYNILKPDSIAMLERYKSRLQEQLATSIDIE